jgi:hypothetical protein
MLILILSYYAMLVAWAFICIWGSVKEPLPWMEIGAERCWIDSVLHVNEDLNDRAQGIGAIQAPLVGSLALF